MKPGAGKRKGNIQERLIYKILREIDPHCKRSLGSGSTDEAADIRFNEVYVIEVKHYKHITDGMLEK